MDSTHHGPVRQSARAELYSTTESELFAPEVIADPHPFYARLRRTCPVSRIGETGVHLVATWELIDEVLQREADFSANLTGVLVRGDDERLGSFAFPDLGANHVIATADEPSHGVHRALVQPGLAAGQVAVLEGSVRAFAMEALAPFITARGGDFVPISELIPARVVARVLGLPDGDVSRHRAWAMMGGDLLAGDVSEPQLIALATEAGQMAEYLGAHLDAIVSAEPLAPEAPLLEALAFGVERGEITREQAIGIAIVMFGAGGESTAALIGSAVRWLAEDAGLADELRGAPHLVPRFVEEVARLEPPFKFHYRSVRRACELGGVLLEPGDRLMLLWASANRDASQFDDPDALRLDRRHAKQHMSFGRGGHFCVGAPLARLEARVVVEHLLARTRSISLHPTLGFAYARSIFVRRLACLPLEVEPR